MILARFLIAGLVGIMPIGWLCAQDSNPLDDARALYRQQYSAQIAADTVVCGDRGGTLDYRGLSWAPVCVIPTRDAGRVCRSHSECEGGCILDIDGGNVDWRSIRPGTETSGFCSAERDHFGCYIPVDGGRAARAICRD